ncbi:MAG: efflux RND transporter periplasmic adaptor subunit [Syntrophomonadaceae bacterium]|jgi:HlyD family secretion protein|nr:efflux RND transporter periplasmic adaptor subunit [Bacillota bacterium]NLP23438.1 efflux RND transporter periplasmic adaptor subunit [Syntrophomonadaceae bacterium]
MKLKKPWVIGIFVVAVIVIAAALMSSGQQVEVTQANKGIFTQVIEETGYVQVIEEQQIQATQTALVSQVLLDAGDRVEKGQLVMILTNSALEAELASVRSQLAQVKSQLSQAELELLARRAELNQAQDDLDRKKALLDAGALAEADYQTAQLQFSKIRNSVAQQESSVAGLAQQVGDHQIMLDALLSQSAEWEVRSSVAGVLLDRPVKKGQVVAPGTLLAQIGADEGMEIKTDLLSDEIGQVQVGQKVTITAPVLGEQSLSGQVGKIYPQAYEKVSALGVIQRRVPVVISLPQTANLRPGYEVRVAIETVHKEDVTLLPREAIRLNSNGDYQVMAVVDNRMVITPVIVGDKNQLWVEIIEGIEPGQIVIRDGSQEVKEGSRVKPVQ